jgi:GNAT superfamily N-acetyltransferase
VGEVTESAFGPPTPITAAHHTADFRCRHEALNQWLHKRALANAISGATRTYVVCADDARVVGYYALAAGSLAIATAPARARRNMPDPLPVVVLGRLAVDERWSGRGIGNGLLKDAVLRSLQAAQIIGACALMCHAIDDEAKRFYAKHGFAESPIEPLTMVLGLIRAG